MRSELAYDTERLRRRQQVQEAEGYLALIAPLAPWATLDFAIRDQLATRAIERLSEISDAEDSFGPAGQLHYLRGRAYCSMEQYDNAIPHLELAVTSSPPHVQACISLGRCFKRLGQLSRAISTLEMVDRGDRHRDVVYYNLACYWSLSNRPEKAVHYLAQAIERNSSYRAKLVEDADFDPIREHPAFVSLRSVVV